ncbi:TKL/TKL-ccin protein kinase [Coprinopsis cinerea AmutBmut pab1-1]|nr:TKL/TKL-ccin protein kinase [Coprinopsis cinerea AmutBmut pab1-1]
MTPKGKKASVQDDPAFKDAKPTDIVIPVMGATGAGKSTFVNLALGPRRNGEHVRVGSNLESCTKSLEFVILDIPDRYRNLHSAGAKRIILVDTPGFDDTMESDVAILKRISNWLAKSYRLGMTVGGLVYMHDLSAARFTGSAKRNLKMFNQLCGGDAVKRVILTTSKWGKFRTEDLPEAAQRQEELQKSFWDRMLKEGARCEPLNPATHEAAWKVLHLILGNLDRKGGQKLKSLQIQREIIDQKKALPQTDAGQELTYTMGEVLEMWERQEVDREEIERLRQMKRAFRTSFGVRVKQMLGVYKPQLTMD